MSRSSESFSSSSTGEQSLFNLKVADFLKEVCNKYQDDVEKTVDQFFGMLVELLLKFNDLLPEYQMQLNRIIRVLVEYGVECRYNMGCKKRPSSISLIDELKNSSSSSSFDHKLVYSELYDLDKKIMEIQELKMQIYSQILKKKPGSVNIKSEIVDESVNEGNSSKGNEEVFDPECVQRVLQGMLNQKESQMVMPSHEVQPGTSRSFEIEGRNLPTEKVFKNPSKNHTSVVDTKVQARRFSKHTTLNKLTSSAICMCVYEDTCMVGCDNGRLQIFNLESGKLMDNIQAHSMRVTSLVIWNSILVTSSLDESLKSFNLIKNSTKRLIVEHPIETTDVSDGVLYAGTSTGKIFRFNMLSLTQMGLMFHVSPGRVMVLKVVHNGNKCVLVISAENKPIVIRCAETGALLKTLQAINIKSFDVCEQNKSWFGISENCLYTMSLDKPDVKQKMLNSILSKVCLFGELILVFGEDGCIYILNQDLVLQNSFSVALKGDVSALAVWKGYLIATHTLIKELNMISPV